MPLSRQSKAVTAARRLIIVAGVCAIALAVCGLVFPQLAGGLLSRRVLAMTASTLFVALAAVSWRLAPSRSGVALGAGLVLCWLGDYLGPIDFAWGAVAFLVGHICFTVAFVMRGVDRRRGTIAIAGLLVVGAAIGCWLAPHLNRTDAVLVGGYMLAISSMVTAAVAGRTEPWQYSATAGAAFYVSDIAVAHWQYVNPAVDHSAFCYPLYYTACVMMAMAPVAWNKAENAKSP